MILISLFSEDNGLSDEIKICYIIEEQSNENRAFRCVRCVTSLVELKDKSIPDLD